MSSTLAEGEKLQAAAYATATIQPLDLGPVINGLIYFFSALATIIIGLRVWVRFFTEQKWGWDDLLAVGGYLAFIPSNIIGVLSTYYGLGASDTSLEPLGTSLQQLLEIRAIEYFMYYEILYFAASATTKVSITLTVLRLCDKQPIYRWMSIGNAVMMIVAAGVSGVFVLTNCRPFATYWNPDLGVCTFGSKGLGSLEIVSLVGSTFQMISDWVSALLPFFIIYKLQMPRRTKIALICILGIGIMASIAALARMLFYKYWDKTAYPDDYLYHTGIVVVTSELEVGLGIVACSLPPLRRLMKNMYSVFRSRTGQSDLNYNNSKGTQLATLSSQALNVQNTKKPGEPGQWERLDDEQSLVKSGTPQSGIVRSTVVNIETSSAETGNELKQGYSRYQIV
ncbi:hypothetical protein SCAR479_11351 [Seiridium cardinale]|uniref:Rhodopsin domain-containing protein n=1 Tax=Seiridium cardinale TaxID=138064 RepID=A0ABR2XE35_9PEZI